MWPYPLPTAHWLVHGVGAAALKVFTQSEVPVQLSDPARATPDLWQAPEFDASRIPVGHVPDSRTQMPPERGALRRERGDGSTKPEDGAGIIVIQNRTHARSKANRRVDGSAKIHDEGLDAFI